jgi:hypothetical protein
MEYFDSKYTGEEVECILDSVGGKQDKLESSVNIKTINGESILGSGDITVATISDVNTAIANAITNAINASY